jgi:Cu(I)/Ag(I) efflux system membrane fusion protein
LKGEKIISFLPFKGRTRWGWVKVRPSMTRNYKLLAVLGCLGMLNALPGTGLVRTAAAQHEGHGSAPAPKDTTQKKQPVPAAEPASEAPVVEIPPDKQQLIGLKTATVTTRALQRTIRTVGRIEIDERRLATIAPKFEGWIEKLYVDYTGKQVKKGEPLAEVYSPELFSTEQEFLSILKWKAAAPQAGVKDDETTRLLSRDSDAIIDAARQRLRLMDIGDEQIREIEATGRAMKTLTLVSPMDGTVIQKSAVSGMRFMPGEKLFDIADLSSVWIVADIYENELSLVREGDTARISLNDLPGREFSARIEYIAQTLSGETRTAKVRLSMPNPEGRLKPQMFTNVELKVNLGKRLVVPDDAVLDSGTRQIVYVDKGDGNFELREVKLGFRAEGFREVLKGLKAGEKIARSATFLIDSEAQLKGIR